MARDTFGAALVSSTFTDLVTGGAGVDTIVMVAQSANIDGAAEVLVTFDRTDASNGDAATLLVFEAPVAAGDAIAPLAGPVLLKPGDKLRGKASANGDANASGWFEELDQ